MASTLIALVPKSVPNLPRSAHTMGFGVGFPPGVVGRSGLPGPPIPRPKVSETALIHWPLGEDGPDPGSDGVCSTEEQVILRFGGATGGGVEFGFCLIRMPLVRRWFTRNFSRKLSGRFGEISRRIWIGSKCCCSWLSIMNGHPEVVAFVVTIGARAGGAGICGWSIFQ